MNFFGSRRENFRNSSYDVGGTGGVLLQYARDDAVIAPTTAGGRYASSSAASGALNGEEGVNNNNLYKNCNRQSDNKENNYENSHKKTTFSSEQQIVLSSEESPVVEGTMPEGLASFDYRLCMFCFDTILAKMDGKALPPLPYVFPKNFEAPLFVTWEKEEESTYKGGNSSDDTSAVGVQLRGCIGSLDPLCLWPGLQTYALKSAFEDNRFQPIQKSELSKLDCKVSLLHSHESCASAYDWVLGTHGIIINFQDDWGRWYSATYLPEVPLEHGMTLESAIRDLCAKAGYTGRVTPDFVKRIEVKRYQSARVKMTFRSYVAFQGMGGDNRKKKYFSSE